MLHLTTTAPARPEPVGRFARFDRDERGEGVISTAIAVLILAFVGAAMWVGFQALTDSTCDSVATELGQTVGGTITCDGP